MPSLTRSDRIRGMIWGQFAGDAAALGAHWIYDMEAMARAFPGGAQGFEAPRAAPYHEGKRSGDQTHYGDGALLLLESVATLGRFDEADFGHRFQEFYGNPATRSYKDHATKQTLLHLAEQPGNFQNGASDDQPGAITRLAPLPAVYRGESELFDAVERATRVTHNHLVALACSQVHAELLARLIRGETFHAALGEVSAELFMAEAETPRHRLSQLVQAAVHRASESVLSTTLHFGQGCPLVKTFPSAIHTAFVHGEPGPDSFREAIVETIRAGGDSAARASLIGAWFGAAHGLDGIPAEWREKLTARKRIHEAVELLLTKIADS